MPNGALAQPTPPLFHLLASPHRAHLARRTTQPLAHRANAAMLPLPLSRRAGR